MKKLLFLLTVCLLVFGMAACSSNDEKANGSDGKKNGKTTVSFSYWGGDEDTERMEAIKAEFEKEHSDIEVKLVLLPEGEEYDQKQTVMFSAGTPYDVIQFAEQSLAYASRGVLEDLTPYIEKDDDVDLSQYYDVAIDAYTHNDKVYGMPLRVSSTIMLYNKDLFDKHDLEYPNEDWTWDDVTEAAKIITDPEEGVFGVSGQGGWWAGTAQSLHSYGGSVLSEDKTEFNLDSPESLTAIEKMQELSWDLDVAPTSTQVPEGVDLWISGKIGMQIDGPWWIISSQKNADFDWDITTAPAGTQESAPIFSNAFHMAKDSKNKDAAWEVISFWTGKTAQEILAKDHGDIPTMKEVAESDLFLDLDGKAPENFAIMLDGLETAFAPEVSLVWTEVNRVVDEGMARIVDLNESIEDVMPSMKAEIEELLEEAEELKESQE
ncbi:ABC transporter substrate-binding protein [Bacillus sp. SD088]|uniref:ABC transporter substrate-binding protein n=1 Tax=Bacillus sp. SD088 TaxID=2782012 RepID=UPI001A97536E|nr:sugar ABC transporter substrate-binding protein [Bacillus sp. SD088]MBO0994724.1 sugar ABC transporter substrate-binding protein [Bacillus sp. SD088]